MTPEQLTKLFQNFNQQKIIIIGDIMLDAYLWGKVERISPESPVPIVSVDKKEVRLGGAANVALNIAALGASPILCSVVGNDDAADTLHKLLQQFNMTAQGILKSKDRKTTIKTRVMSGSHHHIRVDEEITNPISENGTKLLIEKIKHIINQEKAHAIIFEDYDKGVITPFLIEQVVELATKNEIPVIVDPKKRNFNFYKNITLFKPNLKELREGTKNDLENITLEKLNETTTFLKAQQNIQGILLTLSEKGLYLNYKDVNKIFPAHVRNIADVSGAGDTVVSVAALCQALKVEPQYMAMLCNLAGGIVCENAGVVSIDKEKLLKEAIENL